MRYVATHRKQELPPKRNVDYEYQLTKHEPPPIHPEEMLHFFEQPECVDHHSECIRRIPKKVTGPLSDGRIVAWGIHVENGVNFTMVFIVVCIIAFGTAIFVPVHLGRGGSIQDALAPPAFVVGLLAVGIALPQYIEAQQIRWRKDQEF
jgi:hypothetical protein